MIEEKSLVRNTREGYEGIILGTTRMQNLFTGNIEVPFQYRIQLQNTQTIKIAPEEDLEITRRPVTLEDRLATAKVVMTLAHNGRDQALDQYKCVFEIETSGASLAGVVQGKFRDTFSMVRSRTAIRDLESTGVASLRLEIIGEGYDNRCRWCRTFRTILKNAVVEREGQGAFVQDGFCDFDIREGRHLHE